MKDSGAIVQWAPIVLSLFGIVMVFSASYSQIISGRYGLIIRHFPHLILGFSLFYIFSKMQYQKSAMLGKVFLIFSILLLIAVLIKGLEINGARRWFRVPGTGLKFQPSDIARFSIVLFLPEYISRHNMEIKELRYFLPIAILIVFLTLLIAVEPDFSTAGITFFVCLIILFIGGARIPHLGAVFFTFLFVAGMLTFRSHHILSRLDGFVSGTTSQVSKSIIAIGSGGLFGNGLGGGKEKLFNLVYPYSDFMFPVIAEELGFIFTSGLFALFLVYFLNIIKVAKQTGTNLGYLEGVGLGLMIFTYTIVHIMVSMRLLPATGVPLPFLSSGGSSLIINLSAAGIIVSMRRKKDDSNNWWRNRRTSNARYSHSK